MVSFHEPTDLTWELGNPHFLGTLADNVVLAKASGRLAGRVEGAEDEASCLMNVEHKDRNLNMLVDTTKEHFVVHTSLPRVHLSLQLLHLAPVTLGAKAMGKIDIPVFPQYLCNRQRVSPELQTLPWKAA